MNKKDGEKTVYALNLAAGGCFFAIGIVKIFAKDYKTASTYILLGIIFLGMGIEKYIREGKNRKKK